MYRMLWNASVLATGAIGSVGCFHTFQSLHRRSVLAESLEHDDDVVRDAAAIAADLDLELKHVQVFFRHGARTPLHCLEGFKQVSYDHDLVMRPHTLTLFPYQRISQATGLPVEWSRYEQSLRRKNLLRGESIPGHLTGYGQEQMYGLGMRIRDDYGKQLGLSTFDPKHFYVLSTNITRTVESARCVMAGIYGKDQLDAYASQNGPIPIEVPGWGKNILIPDTGTCGILRKVNHAALLHFDFVDSMKADREVLENYIDGTHDLQLNDLTKAQNKVSQALSSYDKKTNDTSTNPTTTTTTTIAYNADRQPYTYDKQLVESIRERNNASDKVSHFWHSVIAHHPTVGKRMPKDELTVLLHLQQLEMEEFPLPFGSGYRFKFHFDSNPYFHNKVICKEVCRRPDGSVVASTVTNIKWKDGKQPHLDQSSTENSEDEVSFFAWLAEKNFHNSVMYDSLKELWRKPLDFYQHVSYKMDHSTTKKINFVFLYDDIIARVTHGWWCPQELLQFARTTEKNGTRMMFYAMTGRHKRERQVVTSLAVGRLLSDMVERAEKVITGDSPERICLYSSHDSTMVSLLESLGLWRDTWPPFGADLRLEVYQDRKSSEAFVRVLVLGQAVKLRGQHTDLLQWSEFLGVVKPYLTNQETFEKICASNFLEEVAKDVLEHEEGEVPDAKKSKKISETPAGM